MARKTAYTHFEFNMSFLSIDFSSNIASYSVVVISLTKVKAIAAWLFVVHS